MSRKSILPSTFWIWLTGSPYYYDSDNQIVSQINVLNKAYSSVGVNFVLKNITRTVKQAWFNLVGPGNPAQTDMKNALRQGGAADLNVYIVGFNSSQWDGLLGYASLPSSYTGNPTDDGVVILYKSLPGGTETNYNFGHVNMPFLPNVLHN
ncbi:hypothetical protein C0991_003056 [Blastosporella zonata]|nr:hypothetical protein C0991_003056 [Blastosporella zonata]